MTDSANTHSGGDADLPTTDDASLERLRHFGGGKLLGEMITLFVQAAPERISAARAGLESNDAKATEMALHALKSSSAQLGLIMTSIVSSEYVKDIIIDFRNSDKITDYR